MINGQNVKAKWNKCLVSPFPPDPFKGGRPKNFGKKKLFFTGLYN